MINYKWQNKNKYIILKIILVLFMIWDRKGAITKPEPSPKDINLFEQKHGTDKKYNSFIPSITHGL